MDFGVFLPVSGRAAGPDTLADFAGRAEALGFATVWAADRIVIPWTITTRYPYSSDQEFIVPPDRPFLEPLTVLSYLAGRTRTIRLGISVLVMPYRHPLYWAKIATTIDLLSGGRFVLGVGAGWMEEEFEALGADFGRRGSVSDEQLVILERALSAERVSFAGSTYQIADVAFLPKATGAMPIWIGGESLAARRRTARFADAWFPYFVRIHPSELAGLFEEVKELATEHGRDPDRIELCCCLPVEVTDELVAQEPDRLRGAPGQLAEAVAAFEAVGVSHMALQFMVPHYGERLRQIEAFAETVLRR